MDVCVKESRDRYMNGLHELNPFTRVLGEFLIPSLGLLLLLVLLLADPFMQDVLTTLDIIRFQ